MKQYKGKWIVHSKGGKDPSTGWEVALVREDNDHGMRSYGWCDDDISDYSKCSKVLIGTYSPSHCAGSMVPEAFGAACYLASMILNRIEKEEEGE